MFIYNIRISSLFFIIIGIINLLNVANSYSATYYVNGTVISDTGDGSISNPKKYITSGVMLMSGGDTLIIKNGTYRGASNYIGDYASPQVFPPNGSSSAYTIIQAETVGGVIIDGEYIGTPFSTVNHTANVNYIRIEGIHFRRGGNCAGVFNIKGDYNKIIKCGFEDGQGPTDNAECAIAFIAGGSSYSLVEDSWVWGKGRYGFYTSSPSGGTNHIIFRRVVVRLDDSPAAWMTAGLRFYNGQYNAMQNCIVIDSHISDTAGEPTAITQGGGSSVSEPGHIYSGVMAINNPAMMGFVPEDGDRIGTVTNSVFWGNSNGIFTSSMFVNPYILTIDNIASGANTGYGVRNSSNYTGLIVNLSNSIVASNGIAFNDVNSVNNVDYYGNTNNTANGSAITNSMTTNPFTSVYKYLPRVENGTVGPSIMYQIGVSGTIYGEYGWNATTDIPLWPYYNETIWAGKMKIYSATGPGGNRGFASINSLNPLTDYVFGYLGNSVPPFNVKMFADNNYINISWDASTVNTNIVGYKVYIGTVHGVYTVTGYEGGKEIGNVTSTTINDLLSGNTYYISVTAIDSVKGESGYSYEGKINYGTNASNNIGSSGGCSYIKQNDSTINMNAICNLIFILVFIVIIKNIHKFMH